VRAGYVSYPDQYSFSSYNAYVSDKPDPLVTFSPLYEGLGEDSNARQSHYLNIVLDEKKMNKQALSRKTIIGSEDFVKKLRERIKLVTKDEEVIEFKYSG